MADKESDAAQRSAVLPSQRVKLQTIYGQALSWAKGYAAPETAAAFARARDLAATNNNPAEKFASIYGQWSVDILRAELARPVSLRTSCWRTRRKRERSRNGGGSAHHGFDLLLTGRF